MGKISEKYETVSSVSQQSFCFATCITSISKLKDTKRKSTNASCTGREYS